MEGVMYDKSKTVTVTIDQATYAKFSYSMPCIVCGEPVELSTEEILSLEYGHSIHSKMCNKCKAAILYMREQMIKEN